LNCYGFDHLIILRIFQVNDCTEMPFLKQLIILRFLNLKVNVRVLRVVRIFSVTFDCVQLFFDCDTAGDAENTFDELKNQWGWGGFTTQDLHRCQLSARAVALIYNWWSLFVRLANPKSRLEAITSRPWLMSAVGRKTEHSGQTTLTITGLHAHFGKAKQSLTKVSTLLKSWAIRAAEQMESLTVWQQCCDYLLLVLTGYRHPKPADGVENQALAYG